MKTLPARQRDPSLGRPRLSSVKWSIPSSEPDTSEVDSFWFDESPRHSFIAYNPARAQARNASRSVAPAIAQPFAFDVWESSHALVVLVDLPGVEAKDFSLSLGSQALYLEVSVPAGGEARLGVPAGKYDIRLEVPPGAGPDAIDAALRHGVLRIRISKQGSGLRRVTIIPSGDAD